MKRVLIVFLATMSMVILPIMASAASEQPQTGGVMTILMTRPATFFGYPARIVGPDMNFAPPFFNHLLDVGDDGKYKPALATSWDVSTDGKTITFKLRKGIKFHDGTDFNAQAVKFNLDQLIPPNQDYIQGVTSFEVVDDYTIKINLTNYNNLIIYQLASSPKCYMYSPTALQKNGEEWAKTHPVGTGPFILKDIQRDTSMTFAKNPDYWEKGLPYLDGMIIKIVPDGMTQMMTFKAGQANAIYDAKQTIAAQLRDAGYTVLVAPGPVYCLAFDAKNSEILGKAKVRQAIEYAIDKEAICEGPGAGLYKPAYQIVPTDSPNYNKSCPPRKYNPEMAKKLLAEAGYPTGFSFRGFFQTNTWKDGVVAVQNYLDEVGIKMEIVYVTSSAFSKIRAAGQIEKGAATQATFLTYSNSLFMMDLYFRSDSTQYGFISKPGGSDALIAQAKSARDQDAATRINQQIAKLVYDDATVVPIWLNPRVVAVDNSVQNPGWFIYNDCQNNMYGFSTWLKK